MEAPHALSVALDLNAQILHQLLRNAEQDFMHLLALSSACNAQLENIALNMGNCFMRRHLIAHWELSHFKD
jgi:hypothetical protein